MLDQEAPGVSGLVAIVTGAAQGIGYAIARMFAENGAIVCMLDKNRERLQDVAEALNAIGRVAPFAVDVTDSTEVSDTVETIARTFGGVHVLVNNAGILRDRALVKMSEADWDDVIITNLKSQFLCIRAVVPYMVQQQFGRIVNIASRAWLGAAGQANYAASKGGVISLTRSAALELAPKGITVNAVAPGLIDTPLFRSLREDVKERLTKAQPTGKIGKPEDVARAVLFFADRLAGYITGQVLYVCGGRSLYSVSL